ncbi:MAG TPA: selenocysteine-specific translation elongation factor [Gemmatimonadaceae bacterium]
MILGTAGHIDHGKTALVRVLTGVETDRLPEEIRRGITIELGFAPLVLDGVGTVGVVDVPGHESFVRTMVAGATGIDLALVVVAADEGVMPQTREHLAILELLGVRRGVVALTKTDLVDAEWLSLVAEETQAAVSRALPQARIIATSARTGAGITELRTALAEVARSVPARPDDDLFRLPIDRVFSIRGTGTVVTGTVWSGRLERDESVRILPGERTARVRNIQGHGAQLAAARPGSRVAIALVGVDVADLGRGTTIVKEHDWRPTQIARADVTIVPGLDLVLRPRTWYRLHVGTAEVGVRVVIGHTPKDDWKPIPARLVLDSPALLRAGDRFVVRTSAPFNTIAGGVITDPYPPKRPRPWPSGLSAPERFTRLVNEAGVQGLGVDGLAVRLGLPRRECRTLIDGSSGRLVVAAQSVLAVDVFRTLQDQLVAHVDEYHAENPLEPGIPMQLLRNRLGTRPELVESVLSSALSVSAIVHAGGLIARTGFAPAPSREQQRHLEAIGAILYAARFEPPSVEELTTTIQEDASPLLRYLERTGAVTHVEANRFYDASQLSSFLDHLRAALAGGAELGPAQLRDALGLSRKFLIPLLEYSDRLGYTMRRAEGRVWRANVT